MKRMLPPIALMLLGGCATGDRGLETVHQPVVDGQVAYVPGCPDWNHDVGGEKESQSSNYGCAFSTNLAMMVADPQDLLHGKSDPTSPEVAGRAFKAWREIPPTYKLWTVTTGVRVKGGSN